MGATNTNVTATIIAPLGGATNAGFKLGYIDSAAKAAQNDTWTVTNATEIASVHATLDSSGVVDAATIAANVITLTTAGTGETSAIIVFR